jgi:uncharacterized protein YbjT (DUF2867 family)
MVGEGVLHECLNDDNIQKVLVIGRRTCGYTSSKLFEIIVPDLADLSSVKQQLIGYDACLFCAGISSVGISAEQYETITYSLTLKFAGTLQAMNPQMVFCYVSGAGTDNSEKGRIRWARVKGKTENDLMKLPFSAVYNFRPGFMQPTKGLKYVNRYYKYFTWSYPLLRMLFPNMVSTLSELGMAMIHVTEKGYDKKILEVKDIVLVAGRR